MLDKVLVANRGAIATRVFRTLRKMGVGSVAVYSEADTQSLHVIDADEAFPVGPPAAAESYLDVGRILSVAQASGAQAIHPGYGFLSENAEFAARCEQLGIRFIGPTPGQMRAFGLKHRARELAEAAHVPLLPGSGLLSDVEDAKLWAERVGYPVMLKSTAGGGGIGLSRCNGVSELEAAFDSVRRLGENNFAEGGVFLEKFIPSARHIEVQIFGDGKGAVVALGERDCSAQRRNQKVIEETPAPGLSEDVREAMMSAAVRLARSVNYRSAGTVEFIYDQDTALFYFLEVNTRLQVEHGVTEAVTGVDLVEWMVRLAAGDSTMMSTFEHRPRGHSIQVRLYAEDPARNFQPSTGLLTEVRFPEDARVESWVAAGVEVSPYYDPMLAKLIVHGSDRAAALRKLRAALEATRISGIESNLAYLKEVAKDRVLAEGRMTTRYLSDFAYVTDGIEVVKPGTQTSVQDYPGRVGYWDVGIPPSGPMDALSFRLANRAVGNAEGAPGLELTMTGPTLRLHVDTVVALAGARMPARLDGTLVGYHEPITVRAGQTLSLGAIEGPGMRTYLAIRGGLDVPEYLGSASTFTLGRFGGHGGRCLRAGDVLRLRSDMPEEEPAGLPEEMVPELSNEWELRVLYGPHGAPDFFTDGDIATFFEHPYEVHYNSARTGVRLIGPKPRWARSDGGEAGLHPSNIHDNAYAIGTVDFTGDMPIILGPDGPSLGGFVCPATIVQSDLWKMGQLRPGDRVRFVAVDREAANAAERHAEEAVARRATSQPYPAPPRVAPEGAVLHRISESEHPVGVVYRQSGDRNVLVEYGPLVLDLELRFRVHSLMSWIQANAPEGIVDLTPGIRSLQVHFDSRMLSTRRLLDLLIRAEAELPSSDDLDVPTRIVHLPLSWDDAATQLAIEKYMQLVRKDAPWCPSNLEFIRRINGLSNIEDVKRVVFDASYLVLGLGDVYLGAPVATPLDPRHRLVTTKYNPARTWTPENAVGIGGAYLCVYGMEGPGGYQFVGRTVQVYNRFRQTADFHSGKPWLLRFFDQIRFYPVSPEGLLDMREAFIAGRMKLDMREETFRLRDYRAFLAENAASIDAFKARQQAAFEAERTRWIESGQLNFSVDDPGAAGSGDEQELPPGSSAVESQVPGSVWKVKVRPGERVKQGDTIVVLESMKMEIAVEATVAGTVSEVRCVEGRAVTAGEPLVVIEEA